MPNILAQIVLFSWPLVAWLLFRKLRPEQAIVATILLGYLFIPERTGFDPPLLPAIDKHLLPVLCAMVGMVVVRRNEARAAKRRRLKGEDEAVPSPGRSPRIRASRITLIIPFVTGMMLLNTVLIWMTNQEPLFYASRVLRGIQAYDIGSMVISIIASVLPLLLAARYLRTRESMIGVLKVLAWCGLAYTPLVLWEVRMSPQLNVQLYGFFAHSWIQHIRDGFRPIVFLGHGLRVGIFLAMATLAAATLFRANADGKRTRWLMMMLCLLLSLSVSRNLGAFLITCALLPLILFTSARIQILAAAFIAATVMIFPLARGSGLVPADRIVSWVAMFSPERAGSFQFRLDNEDILLAKANQKPISGWGGWGRSRVFNEETGRDESVTDGSWIIIIGNSGWIGYLGIFGLLCLPIIPAALRWRRYNFGVPEAGFALVLCANLIDLIPNSSLLPLIWLIAGVVWGRLTQASTEIVAERLKKNARRAPRERSPRPERQRPAVQSANTAPSNT